jgi:hypothetical protein
LIETVNKVLNFIGKSVNNYKNNLFDGGFKGVKKVYLVDNGHRVITRRHSLIFFSKSIFLRGGGASKGTTAVFLYIIKNTMGKYLE